MHPLRELLRVAPPSPPSVLPCPSSVQDISAKSPLLKLLKLVSKPLPKEVLLGAPKGGKARGWRGARASSGGASQNGVSVGRPLVVAGEGWRPRCENWQTSDYGERLKVQSHSVSYRRRVTWSIIHHLILLIHAGGLRALSCFRCRRRPPSSSSSSSSTSSSSPSSPSPSHWGQRRPPSSSSSSSSPSSSSPPSSHWGQRADARRRGWQRRRWRWRWRRWWSSSPSSPSCRSPSSSSSRRSRSSPSSSH